MLNKDLARQYIRPQTPIPTGLKPSLRSLKGIQCVLFDIYGTLLISASGDTGLPLLPETAVDPIKRLLKKFGISLDPQGLAVYLQNAIEADHQAKKERGIQFPEIEIDRIWMRILGDRSKKIARDFALEYELIINPVYPMPHLKESLLSLRSKKIKLGLISNAQFYTTSLLNWFLGASAKDFGFHPALIFLSYQVGWAKPSLEMFKKAADTLCKLGIEPQATLFVGNDMLNDILPASQTGFKTALFAGDSRSLRLRQEDPRCRGLKADIVLIDLIQLPELII